MKYVMSFLQNIKQEIIIRGLSIVKKAANSLTKVGHYRNIAVTSSVIHRYKFKLRVSRYLLRRIGDHPHKENKDETEKPNLQIETLLEIFRKQNMHEREGTDFAIKQFDGTQKATDWILEYETECEKYEIQNDEKRIKNLKKYLGKTASEWYQTNLPKDEEYNWENWKAAFLKAFSNKGWSAVRYAYNFKYISGSITEYAIKKEQLILEVRRKISKETRINLIVIGLLIHIQDKIDKEAVQSTNDLIGLLGQYEDQTKG